MPGSQFRAPLSSHAPYSSSGKQSVPCVFFLRGQCSKGDRCAYLHGSSPSGNKITQSPAATTPVTELPSLRKVVGGLAKCTTEQKTPQTNISKSIKVCMEKPATKTEIALPKHLAPPASLPDELHGYQTTQIPSSDGNIANRSNRMHQSDILDDHNFQNGGKDAEEFYRESSPGFDVLVDDDVRDSDYYHNEDQFGGDGRNLSSMNEFDIGQSSDYNSVADMEREVFRDPHGYDSYEHIHRQHAWDHHRSSSERALMGAAAPGRRGYRQSVSPDQIDESDLRHRISKRRRVNGLRSVVSHDYDLDKPVEARGYRGLSRRDSPHVPTHDCSLSSRLRGRIKLPVKLPRTSSPTNDSDLYFEKDMDQGRNRGRLSPGRQQTLSQQGRLRDRIKGRVQEDSSADASSSRNQRIRRDVAEDGRVDFAGPKRLAELKVVKHTLGSQRSLKMEGYESSEADLSFEGPKPLSEILKRKRAETEETLVNEDKENPGGSKTTEVAAADESSEVPHMNENEKETEDGELEGFDQRDGGGDGDGDGGEDEEGEGHQEGDGNGDGYEDADGNGDGYEEVDGNGEYEEYEQGDEGEYNLEEGENVDPDFMEEDEDDFAKKMGVMFS